MNQLVFIDNGRAVTDSLTVADCFGKRHADVLRDIEVQLEKLNQAGERKWGLSNFAQTHYQHPQNKQFYRKYLLTEDAFALVAMSYVTPEAMKMKVKFIQEFKRMKEQLLVLNAPSYMIEDPIKRAERWIEEQREKQALEQKLALAQPKIEQHDRFLSGENYQKVGEVAKILGYGRNNFFKKLRQMGLLMNDNTPYQKYIDRGYFVVKEKPIQMGDQIINKPQTYITAKGIAYIDKLLHHQPA